MDHVSDIDSPECWLTRNRLGENLSDLDGKELEVELCTWLKSIDIENPDSEPSVHSFVNNWVDCSEYQGRYTLWSFRVDQFSDRTDGFVILDSGRFIWSYYSIGNAELLDAETIELVGGPCDGSEYLIDSNDAKEGLEFRVPTAGGTMHRYRIENNAAVHVGED